ARERGCRVIEALPVTVLQPPRPAPASSPPAAPAAAPAAPVATEPMAAARKGKTTTLPSED
ncbi:MAG: hypothetical protein EB119_08735, partial [Synechococcaceae bacterium WBB_34_004]|nr:hypothetical protein [Synechococcaceae bacterium WBB_34_004]